MRLESLNKLISRCKTNKEVREVLKRKKISYTDKSWVDSDGCEVLSLYLDDLKRIYRPHGRKSYIAVQMQQVTMNYSGIPTFMPSGRNTFADVL